MIFAARQLQEFKCIEQYNDLYETFVDLTKAFITVSREGLWKIMGKSGYPGKFIAIVPQFHDGMTARVVDDCERTEAFPVTNGVKQGCVMPRHCSAQFFRQCSQIPSETVSPSSTSGTGLTESCSTSGVKLRDFLFDDGCTLNAGDEQEMQLQIDRFSSACDNFGLKISNKKTEVMVQLAPGNQYHEPQIQVNGQTLQAVETFTYLGNTLSRNATIDAEINRISKESNAFFIFILFFISTQGALRINAFGKLRKNVWDRRGIKLPTKLKVY